MEDQGDPRMGSTQSECMPQHSSRMMLGDSRHLYHLRGAASQASTIRLRGRASRTVSLISSRPTWTTCSRCVHVRVCVCVLCVCVCCVRVLCACVVCVCCVCVFGVKVRYDLQYPIISRKLRIYAKSAHSMCMNDLCAHFGQHIGHLFTLWTHGTSMHRLTSQ